MSEAQSGLADVPKIALRPSMLGGEAKAPLSYIEPFEEVIAKKLVDEQFMALTGKSFGLRPGGYMVAVKIYVRPEELKEIDGPDGKKVKLYIPHMSQTDDKYQSVAALVCAVGPQAYKGRDLSGNDRFPEGPWCKIGDWVAIPRHESFLISYRGVAVALIPDDKILAVIEDPTDVQAAYVADKV